MAGYGYTTPAFTAAKPPPPRRPPVSRSLAMAAAAPSQADPFGLNPRPTPPGPQLAKPPINNSILDYARSAIAGPAKGITLPPGSVAGASGGVNTAPVTQAYDINTDPAFQSTVALTGMGDEQAQAAALKDKQQALLGYGDANLIRSVLGDATLAQAAANNPTSTLAQLSQQRGRNVNDLTEGLNKANLLYSGYRVTQEDQAAQDYQNELAAAAAAVNGNLGAIDSNLAGALGSNQAQRIAAMQAAYAAHTQDGGAGGDLTLPSDTLPPAASGAGSLTGTPTGAESGASLSDQLRRKQALAAAAAGGGGGLIRTT